jgi:hypothetical protein
MKKTPLILLLTLAVAACGGASDADEMPEADVAGESAIGTVTITFPTDGAVVDGPTVTVELASTVPIVPAGEMTPGTGHHHLYLDADLTEVDVPVPTVEGSIVHMGDASSSFTFEGVSAGSHRLIAVVADGAHIPLQPLVVDTVEFTVREP